MIDDDIYIFHEDAGDWRVTVDRNMGIKLQRVRGTGRDMFLNEAEQISLALSHAVNRVRRFGSRYE